MSLEKFLVVREDGQAEKSKSFDKIDTRASSFLAPIPSQNPSTTFDILSGSVYIDNAVVNFNGLTVDLSTGANYETSAIPSNHYNIAIFTLSPLGLIEKVEGTPASTAGGVVSPTLPSGNFPIARVLFQDNGIGGTGTVNNISEEAITDIRPFFYGSYGKPVFGTNAVADFKALPTIPESASIRVTRGSLWMNDGNLVSIPDTTISFSSGALISPSIPANWYNKAIVVIDSSGVIRAYWGTPAILLEDVVLAETPTGAMPIAIVTVRDNGNGNAGTLNDIFVTDLEDVRPFFNNFLGQLKAEDLSYCRVKAYSPATQQIEIFSGIVYPKAGLLVNFPKTVIDFSSGVNAVPITTSGYYRKILITLNAAGDPLIFYGNPSATLGGLVAPPTPRNVIALAYLTVQDDGSGLLGSILPISDEDIQDVRPFLGASGGGGGEGTTASQSYSDYLNTSTFEQGFYEDFSDNDYIDESNTTADADVIVDNNTTFQVGEVLQTTNIFDSSLSLTNVPRILILLSANFPEYLDIEVSNNGGSNWSSVTPNTVKVFTTVGTDLRVKFTNSGIGEVVLTDWAIFYNDDEISPSFLFSNERLPLNQTINFGESEISGNVITLKDGRYYPVGENALLVFKNGELLRRDSDLIVTNSYKELNTSQIQVSIAPQAGDYYQLAIPAGFFGQSVTEFTASLNNLLPAKYIVDELVRVIEGTTSSVKTAIESGGRVLLETQNWNLSEPIEVTQHCYIYSKTIGETTLNSNFPEAILEISSANEFTLENIKLSSLSLSPSGVGVTISSSGASANFFNCLFENLEKGVEVTGETNSLFFKNCKFIDCDIPVIAKDNASFENCVFENCSISGVSVENNGLVMNCKFINCFNGLNINGLHNIIKSNHFIDCEKGLIIESTGGETVISGNKILNSISEGCQINGNRVVFTNNICKGNDTGVNIEGSENMIEGNIITDNLTDGIVVGLSAINNDIGSNVLLRNP